MDGRKGKDPEYRPHSDSAGSSRGHGGHRSFQTPSSPDGGVSPDSPTDEVYCICRGRSDGRFMIFCEKCEDWFHGECINVTRAEARNIEMYFCPPCLGKHSHLTVVYKESFLMRKSRAIPDYDEREREGPAPPPGTVRCGECIGCYRAKICEKCDGCMAGRSCDKMRCIQPRIPVPKPSPSKARKPRKQQLPSDDDDKEYMEPQYIYASDREATVVEPKKRGRKKGTKNKNPALKKIIDQIQKDEEERNITILSQIPPEVLLSYPNIRLNIAALPNRRRFKPMPFLPRQCQNPDCIQQANDFSKYCSDECGLALAEKRLKMLPDKLLEYWAVKPQEIERNEQKEKELKDEMVLLSAEQEKYTKWIVMLMNYVEAIKALRSDEVEDVVDGTEGETMVGCPVCAVEHPSRLIFKHVERCYVKQEKQVTYGAVTMTLTPERIFCDIQNKDGSYCRRLRVTCPEHYKGEIEADIEVCGCPKAWHWDREDYQHGLCNFEKLFSSADEMLSKGMCSVSRKNCTVHHKWLQMVLGSLDCNRQQILVRLSEIFAERKAIGDVTYGDASMLMCNNTIHHRPLDELIKVYNEKEEEAFKASNEAVETNSAL